MIIFAFVFGDLLSFAGTAMTRMFEGSWKEISPSTIQWTGNIGYNVLPCGLLTFVKGYIEKIKRSNSLLFHKTSAMAFDRSIIFRKSFS